VEKSPCAWEESSLYFSLCCEQTPLYFSPYQGRGARGGV